MTRDAAQGPGSRVVHHPHPRTVRGRGRAAAQQLAAQGAVAGLGHAQGPEHVTRAEGLEGLAAHGLRDLTQQDVAQVAVEERLPRGRLELPRADPLQRPGGPLPVVVHVIHRSQASRVEQQLLHGDGVPVGALERGEERGDAVREGELALLDQHHDRRGGRHRLGQRGEVEDRVQGHGTPGDRSWTDSWRTSAPRPTTSTAPGMVPARTAASIDWRAPSKPGAAAPGARGWRQQVRRTWISFTTAGEGGRANPRGRPISRLAPRPTTSPRSPRNRSARRSRTRCPPPRRWGSCRAWRRGRTSVRSAGPPPRSW